MSSRPSQDYRQRTQLKKERQQIILHIHTYIITYTYYTNVICMHTSISHMHNHARHTNTYHCSFKYDVHKQILPMLTNTSCTCRSSKYMYTAPCMHTLYTHTNSLSCRVCIGKLLTPALPHGTCLSLTQALGSQSVLTVGNGKLTPIPKCCLHLCIRGPNIEMRGLWV